MAKKLVIIGSGPSGLTAAIYAARADLQPVVIEGFMKGGQPGGQLMTTTEVENFPGFPEGIDGPELISRMRKQAERFGTEFIMEDIDSVDFSSRPFTLSNASRTITAHSIIIATGASAIMLDLPSVKTFWGKGISACATCDGALPIFRNQVIAVVGGGDSAIEEACYLGRFASKVLLIHRRDEFRASKAMRKRAFDNPKIEIIFDSVLEEAYGSQFLEGVKLKNVKTSQLSDYACKGLFMSIGHTPNTGFVKNALEIDAKGYIKVKTPSTATSVEGVFAAGDVTDPHYRQAISAAGTGCVAALDAERWLQANGLG
ncbi:MAG: thioredoxin-disulfide reductase [Candidatus Riflebacteria bacterium HGW-Riflebacteria-1]|jgi:thioredoxin reductase (NADPH)|nr:MAG: thioredoxin-disulfide reductase [Candidatus Riflebacteria bacterium HGW-Riflebacteria-1]